MNVFFRDILEKKACLPLFIALTILYATSYFQRIAIPGTIFNLLQKDYGLSAEEISGLGASYIGIYAICQLLIGMLADKYSGIRVVTWGGIVFCIGVLVFPLVLGNLPLMYITRMLVGLGSSVMFLSLVRESDRLFGRKNYSVILGIVYFVGYSGGLFGTLPFAMLCEYFAWQKVLLTIGLISTVMYLIFILGKRSVPQTEISGGCLSLQPLFGLLKNPYTWLLGFCATVNFSSYFIIQSVFGMKFLQDFVKMPPGSASAIIFSLTLVCMVTLLCGGILTKLIGQRRKPLIIFAASVALGNTIMMFCAVYFHLPPFVFGTGYLLYALASGFNVIYIISCQEVNSKDTQTQAAGILNSFNYMAVAVFSVLVGKLLDHFVKPEAFVAGRTVIYPDRAYLTIFALLLIPTALAFVVSFFVPETKGHYIHLEKSHC